MLDKKDLPEINNLAVHFRLFKIRMICITEEVRMDARTGILLVLIPALFTRQNT